MDDRIPNAGSQALWLGLGLGLGLVWLGLGFL